MHRGDATSSLRVQVPGGDTVPTVLLGGVAHRIAPLRRDRQLPGGFDRALRPPPRRLQLSQVLAAENAPQDRLRTARPRSAHRVYPQARFAQPAHEAVPEEAALLVLEGVEGKIVATELQRVPAGCVDYPQQVGQLGRQPVVLCLQRQPLPRSDLFELAQRNLAMGAGTLSFCPPPAPPHPLPDWRALAAVSRCVHQ